VARRCYRSDGRTSAQNPVSVSVCRSPGPGAALVIETSGPPDGPKRVVLSSAALRASGRRPTGGSAARGTAAGTAGAPRRGRQVISRE